MHIIRIPQGSKGFQESLVDRWLTAEGFVKVIRGREDEKLLGVHMIGHNATEVIAAATALVGQKVSAKDMAETVFAHPTISKALKESAEASFGAALHLPPKKVVRVVDGEQFPHAFQGLRLMISMPMDSLSGRLKEAAIGHSPQQAGPTAVVGRRPSGKSRLKG